MKRQSLVSIAPCQNYHGAEVENALRQALSPWGGMEAFVRPGYRVLIKPNLVAAADPGAAVTTHPSVVSALARLVLGAGGTPLVGDSPAAVPLARASRAAGIDDVCRETGALLLPFEARRTVDYQGFRPRSLGLAADFLEADLTINAAKMKTHTLTGFTGAVKNCFGLVVGRDKARFHLRHPSPLDFAHLLLDVYQAASPALSIMDGIIGMEGPGPRNGRPRAIGLVLASTSAIALDTVCGRILGYRDFQIPTVAAARDRGMTGARWDTIDVAGPQNALMVVPGFDRGPAVGDRLGSIIARLPGSVARNLAHRRRPYPRVTHESCTRCGRCIEICPPQVLEMHPVSGDVMLDRELCIKCYCCQEICPKGSITLHRSR